LRTLAYAAAATLVFAACDDDPEAIQEVDVARVVIAQNDISIRELQTIALDVEALDARGNRVAVPITFSSSAPEKATVDGEGNVTGQWGGYTLITARAGGREASVLVYVEEYPATIAFETQALLLFPTASVDLHPTVYCRNGHEMNVALSWLSDDEGIALVNNLGRITAVSPGQTTVSASADDVESEITIVVAEQSEDISVQPRQVRLRINEQAQFEAFVRGTEGTQLPATPNWSVLDPSIAAIAANGNVIALAPGATTVAAEFEGHSALALVVVDEPVARIVVSPPRARLAVGDLLQLEATAFDSRNGDIEITFAWSTDNAAAAMVDANGVVTARGAGIVRIAASAEGMTGYAELNIEASAASLEIMPQNLGVPVGGSGALRATAKDASGNITSPKIKWSSSDETILTVNERGDVFGWSPGNATVTAEADGLTATAPVTVFPAVASVRIEPAAYTLEYWWHWFFWPIWGEWRHESVQLNAVVLDLLGNEISVPVTWSTSNGYYATVNSSGRVTASHHTGTATITAEAGGMRGTAVITVQHR
jgi:uncharacterized protein YjdB